MRRMPLNAEELEKIRYIEDTYDFSTEQVQHASKDPRYAKLIELMNEAPKKWCGAVLINDLTNQTLYTGVYTDKSILLYTVYSNVIESIEIEYAKFSDDMEITNITESLLSEDNVKTIFGKDIVGTGDINLYRHQLEVTMQDAERKIFIELKSSNEDPINTLQQFNEATNAKEGMIFSGTCDDTGNIASARIYYEENTWKGAIAEDFGMIVISFKDIVTPIQ